MLAENDNQSVEVILACFFYDIGHLIEFNETMGNYGTKNHEKIGANIIYTLEVLKCRFYQQKKSTKFAC